MDIPEVGDLVEFLKDGKQFFLVLVLEEPFHLPNTEATYQFFGYCLGGYKASRVIGKKTKFNMDLDAQDSDLKYVITKANQVT